MKKHGTLEPTRVFHGLSYSKERGVWANMIQRCYNHKNKSYKFYGGRGITVCDEWKNSVAKFFEDMGFRPTGTFLDRIDNSKGYSKENCRWTTREINMRNTRGNVLTENDVIEIRKLNLSAKEIFERYCVSKGTAYNIAKNLSWVGVGHNG